MPEKAVKCKEKEVGIGVRMKDYNDAFLAGKAVLGETLGAVIFRTFPW